MCESTIRFAAIGFLQVVTAPLGRDMLRLAVTDFCRNRLVWAVGKRCNALIY